MPKSTSRAPAAPVPALPAVATTAPVATTPALAPAAALAPVPVADPAAAASTTFGAGSGVLGLTFGSFQGGDLGALLSGAERLDGQAGNTLGARVCPAASQADAHTGEEHESIILQVRGRLYADPARGLEWRERGTGPFSVNVGQDGAGSARLVMRREGAPRVILNVGLLPGMTPSITGDRYVRFAGIEDGTLVWFLLKVRDATAAREVVESIMLAKDAVAGVAE